ncbi:MAG: adenylosuccinate synthase [Bacteroidales bacterium]|nr:adenylosuccinate synthase [Bacteroidales bacterium]
MNKIDILLGLQWGDEGKGKVVDALTPNYDIVARFQGGPNAGHTIEFEGKKFVLHNIPSGVLTPGCVNIIGNGVIIEPHILKGEVEGLKQAGFSLGKTLMISNRAHLILPTHRALDAANEKALGKMKIGSTLKGIGPTYTDKTARKGLRIGDIAMGDFMAKYEKLKQAHLQQIASLGFDMNGFQLDGMDFADYEKLWFEGVDYIRQFPFIDSEYYINEALDQGKKVLAEGAQGSMLDVDFGSYPFVTSSNVIAAGVCNGLGIAPNRIGKVYGIFKAYCTRVGTGPFPTELFDATGETLRQNGHEFGATTGRPRRCGWLDLPALKYAVMLSGVTDLMMMKSDVMDEFETIKVATAYRYNGQETQHLPFAACTETMEPVYAELPGWREKIEDRRQETEDGRKKMIPERLEEYIEFIENYVGVPIKFVSYGPDRTQNIIR